jgi:hypothetical protein
MKAIFLSILCLLTGSAFANQVVYPAKNQSPEQQAKDESACHGWAVQNSAYDPTNPPPMPQAAAAPAQPSGPTGARARGAIGGAMIGGIADGDVGAAALTGAVLGGVKERSARRHAQQQAQTAATQQQEAAMQQRQAGESAYFKSRAACLEGKGYIVK